MPYKVKVTKEKEIKLATKKEILEDLNFWKLGSLVLFTLTMIILMVAWLTYDYRALITGFLGVIATIFYYSHYQTDRILARMEWKEK